MFIHYVLYIFWSFIKHSLIFDPLLAADLNTCEYILVYTRYCDTLKADSDENQLKVEGIKKFFGILKEFDGIVEI